MSVAKMPDGKRWYCSVRYKDWTGKTKQHKKEGFATRAAAKKYEEEFLAKKTGSPNMTFAALYEHYMEDCKARLRETTYTNKVTLFARHVLPALGDIEIESITPAQIRKWQNGLIAQGYKKTYLKTVNNQLSAVFNYACKYYGLKANPVRAAGSIGKKNADSMQFWTVDEFNTFVQAVKNKPASVVIFNLLFWTGMRQGELLALTAADFDFGCNTVRINKSYARLNKKDIISDPKTPKSNRTIALPPFLADMVKEYIASLYDQSGRIFPYTKQYIFCEMERGCKLSGVKRIRVHDLRHSHASLLIELGYSPLLIADRLGHENIETTLQTYSHLYPNKESALIADLTKCYDSVTPKKS